MCKPKKYKYVYELNEIELTKLLIDMLNANFTTDDQDQHLDTFLHIEKIIMEYFE